MVTPHSGETDSLEVVVDIITSTKYTSFLTSYMTNSLGTRQLICDGIMIPELKTLCIYQCDHTAKMYQISNIFSWPRTFSFWQWLLVEILTEQWQMIVITDNLFTSVAVPLCLATDRLKFFVVNNHLTNGVSFNLESCWCRFVWPFM